MNAWKKEVLRDINFPWRGAEVNQRKSVVKLHLYIWCHQGVATESVVRQVTIDYIQWSYPWLFLYLDLKILEAICFNLHVNWQLEDVVKFWLDMCFFVTKYSHGIKKCSGIIYFFWINEAKRIRKDLMERIITQLRERGFYSRIFNFANLSGNFSNGTISTGEVWWLKRYNLQERSLYRSVTLPFTLAAQQIASVLNKWGKEGHRCLLFTILTIVKLSHFSVTVVRETLGTGSTRDYANESTGKINGTPKAQLRKNNKSSQSPRHLTHYSSPLKQLKPYFPMICSNEIYIPWATFPWLLAHFLLPVKISSKIPLVYLPRRREGIPPPFHPARIGETPTIPAHRTN